MKKKKFLQLELPEEYKETVKEVIIKKNKKKKYIQKTLDGTTFKPQK